MDGSSPATFDERTCDGCGYALAGLPVGAVCPECGTASRATRHGRRARLDGERAWLLGVASGLALLVVASAYALESQLHLNLGGLTLIAINAPAPKLAAAAMILREIGQPADNGVRGTLAAFAQLLAIWMITARRGREGEPDGLALAARWVATIALGLFTGALVGGYLIDDSRFWGWNSSPGLIAAIAGVELPANVLLYAHLARLSRRFDPMRRDRPQFGLDAAAWLIGATCAAVAAETLVRSAMQDRPVELWRAAQSIVGALSLASGMVMTFGTLRLAGHVWLAALGRPALPAKLLATRWPRWIERVRAEPARFAAAAGVAVWLWSCWTMIADVAIIVHRRGFGGDLPVFNFLGPKVVAAPITLFELYGHRFPIFATVLAVWAMTSFRPAPAAARTATLCRWATTILLGLAVGFALTIELSNSGVRESIRTAALLAVVEAPATFFVYCFLARVAPPTLARPLAAMSIVGPAITLSALGLYAVALKLRPASDDWRFIVPSAAYGTATIAVSVIAWALCGRLLLTLALSEPSFTTETRRHGEAI